MFYSVFCILCCFLTTVLGEGLGNGIVFEPSESSNKDSVPQMSWPGEPGMMHYHHHVECDHIHQYMYHGEVRKFHFELQCLTLGEVNIAPDYKVFIHYDNNALDSFSVKSCSAEEIVGSIFPPRQREDYPDKDDENLPNTAHLRYRTVNGHCFDRMYSFVNKIYSMADRHDPIEIICPSDKDEWFNPTTGVSAHFGNCRIPKVPVPHNVLDWYTKDKPLDWFPGLRNDDGSRKYTRLLECDWDKVTYEWKLLCVQMEGTSDLLAFVSRSNEPLERFTVEDCKEDNLVNSIFVNRFTTCNKVSECAIPPLYFAAKDGKCFERAYQKGKIPEEPKTKDCPKHPDDWVNPTTGFAGMFGHCKEKPDEKSDSEERETEEANESKKEEPNEVRKEIKAIRLADNPGSVIKAFSSGSREKGEFMGWTGEPEMLEYKHYVECDHIHEYPYYWGYMRRFRFELHCLSFGTVNGAPDYTVFIDYDYNVLDRFNVTSCEPEEIVNSIFAPRQRPDYPEKDSQELPNTHHLRYITTDRKCIDRKYKFVNRISRMAERLDPEDISCPSNFDEWLNPSTGWFAKFGNCRVPVFPVPHTVVDWVTEEKPLVWYPGKNDENQKYQQLLKCDWDRLTEDWVILCVKVEGEEHYKAFLSYAGNMKERFTVTSCKEEDLVNSIFPPRYPTTAHPERKNCLRFAVVQKNDKGEELCYERTYGWNKGEPVVIPCPKYEDEWVNPTQGFAGMFGHCIASVAEEVVRKGDKENRQQEYGEGESNDVLQHGKRK